MQVRVKDCDDAAFSEIAPRLRAEDIEEWRLFAGGSPAHLVRDGYKLPSGADTLNRIAYGPSGRALCVWGVSPFQAKPDVPPEPNPPGWVWLVATPEAEKHAKSIHHHLRAEFTDTIVPMFPRLVTASWVGNTHHHTWLRWLGFKQAFVAMPMGVHGADFIPFTYTRSE
jgi:hypothetical protein